MLLGPFASNIFGGNSLGGLFGRSLDHLGSLLERENKKRVSKDRQTDREREIRWDFVEAPPVQFDGILVIFLQ
jgi:hypothetical protein